MKYQTNGAQVRASFGGETLIVAQAADYVTAQLIAEALNTFTPQKTGKVVTVEEGDKGRRVIYTGANGVYYGTITGSSPVFAYVQLDGDSHSKAIVFERLEWDA